MDIRELNVKTKDKEKVNHPWEMARFNVVMDILKPYIKKKKTYSELKNILDIGCGDAFFISEFWKRNTEITPYVLDTAFNNHIITKLKDEYSFCPIRYYKDINEINIDNGQCADIVFLLDVIEHIADDKGFLLQLKSLPYINSDTIFLITVPAFNSLFCRHDKWLQHYRRYSYKALRTTIEESGFTTQRGGYFFFGLLFPRIIQKLIEKPSQDSSAEGIGNYSGGAFTTKIYQSILQIDYYISKFLAKIGIKLPGLSAYIIMVKS